MTGLDHSVDAHPKGAAFELHEAIAVLERTPAALEGLLAGVPPVWRDATEGPGSWSPFAVVAHLIHGERTNWMPRARHILSGASAPFDGFDRNDRGRDTRGKTLDALLQDLADLRRDNVAELRSLRLSDGDLERSGLHPELGVVRLRELLATWVVHDLDHVTQIARTMAKGYAGHVGPWAVYLSVLRDRT